MNITDGTTKFEVRDKRLNTLLDLLYPIGSIKITTGSAPAFGTWKEVGSGRVLWGASSTNKAGTTLEAGLPNITGKAGHYYCYTPNGKTDNHKDGAFGWDESGGGAQQGNSNGQTGSGHIRFNASQSNAIYGKSSTVQPPAYVVHFWQRTA